MGGYNESVCGSGQWSEMVVSTIDLGISILMGGNTDVQKVCKKPIKM